ncbi:hypothetical protein [Thiothrix sp.]|jgi:hypothetical protein|uniref:hypothetical protein n=1 Tax=Thiothrix sp. TaxID=1032 RepID=UPI00257FB3CF|nr:hypothetical protein [Thiothrix sp.]
MTNTTLNILFLVILLMIIIAANIQGQKDGFSAGLDAKKEFENKWEGAKTK